MTAYQLAQAYVAIVPSMANVGKAISSTFDSVSKSVGTSTGRSIGKNISSAVSGALSANPLEKLEQQVKFAQQDIESAMRNVKTSTLGARAAQLKYNETVQKYGSTSSQAVTAEKRMIEAKYSSESASKRLTTAENRLKSAQQSLSSVKLKGPDTSASESKFALFTSRIRSAFTNIRANSAGATAATEFGSGFAAKIGVISGVVSSIVSRIFTSITSNISDAISRADTLNNFPKIMVQLGYSATDASDQVEKLSDRITGLPTTLDSIVSTVKRLAPISSSLSSATNIALAFNDAIVAGGASTTLQENAMEQLLQQLSAGKVDLAAWKSMENAMPAQLTEVAKAMLGQSANAQTLYESLKDGDVTLSQFTAKVVELDAKGGKGFSSFQTQAKQATSGISTNLTNLKTAITRGLANVLQIARNQINGAIQGLTAFVNSASTYVSSFLGTLFSTGALQTFASAVGAVGSAIWGVVSPIGKAVLGLMGLHTDATTASGSAKQLASFLKELSIKLQSVAQWVKQNSDRLGPLAVEIAVGTAAFIGFTKAVKAALVIQKFFTLIAAGGWIGLVVAAIAAVTAGLIYFFTQTKTGRKIWSQFTSFLTSAWAKLKSGFASLVSWFSAKWDALKGVVSGWGTAISSAMKPGLDRVGKAWNALWQTVGSTPGRFMSSAWTAIQRWLSVIKVGWQIAWDVVSGVFRTKWNMLVAFLGPVLKGVWAMIKATLSNVAVIWRAGWTVIGTVLKALWNTVTIIVSTALGVVRGIIQTVVALIRGDWSGAWNGVKTVFGSIWGGIKALASNYMKAVSSVISTVLKTISSVWSNTWNGVKSLFSGIWSGLKAAAKAGVSGVASTVKGVKGTIVGYFKGAGSWLKDAGTDIIHGIWKGMSSVGDWLRRKVESVADWIPAWIRKKLGIASPSRVMAQQVGQWIPKGIALGITSSASTVRTTISGLASKIAGWADAKKISSGLYTSLESTLAKANTRLQKLANERASIVSKLKAAQKSLTSLQTASGEYRSNIISSLSDLGNVSNYSTADQMVANLEKQASSVSKVTAELAALRKKGLDDSSYQELLSAFESSGSTTAIDALYSSSGSVVKKISALRSKLSAASKTLAASATTDMYGVAVNAAKGLVKGLKAQQGALNKVATSMANSLVTTVKKKLGIHSPSRVMRDQVGRFIPAGLAEGISGNLRAVTSAAAEMSSAATGVGTSISLPSSRLSSSGVVAGRSVNLTLVDQIAPMTAEQRTTRSAMRARAILADLL